MIYSYTITKKFLEELAELDYNECANICVFIETNFIKTENLYLKINREILNRKYGKISNDKIDNLIKMLSNQVKDIFSTKTIPIDLALSGAGDVYPRKITCKYILEEKKKVEQLIEDICISSWHGDDLKQNEAEKKLENHFKRILNFNQVVSINSLYLLSPLIEMSDNKIDSKKKHGAEKQLKQFKFFFSFLSKIKRQNRTKIKFYTTINNNKMNIITKQNLNINEIISKLYNSYLIKDDEIIIKKYSSKLKNILHRRIIVTFIDDFDDNEEPQTDNLNIFSFDELTFFNIKNAIEGSAYLEKIAKNSTHTVYKKNSEYIDKTEDFLRIAV